MAVAKSNRNCESNSCICYKVASLSETILGIEQTSNFQDRYSLGEQLGWGQFGVIRTCSDKSIGEVLACKSISKERLVTSDDLKSVKLEIEIMTRLSGHPNVVDLKAVYEEEDYVHLVMELCAGGELFHQLAKIGCFSESEARILFRHFMEVVLYCHDNGVVHRDLKPENILLATRSSSSPIKLADFGLATYIKPGRLQLILDLHSLVGSPFYIAPEVLAGAYNQAADVWSAGFILYILLSGMPPFWGKTKSRIFDAVRAADLRFPSKHWDHISKSAKDLIKGMLCADSSLRLTAKQVLAHSWMDVNSQGSQEPTSACETENSSEWKVGSSSFSASFMSRNQDISFGAGLPKCDAQSPTFTCRSSFSFFLVEPLADPCSASEGFSFQSSEDSSGLVFPSPVSSTASFTFYSHCPANEQNSCMLPFTTSGSNLEAIHGESSLEKVLVLSGSPVGSGNRIRQIEQKQVEFKRPGGTNGYKILGILSKRNRTIGLGEHEKLDFMVSESFIRWSSCTHLPTSLKSSLVC